MRQLKELAMITVAALAFMLITGVAKAEEKTTTPQEFVNTIAAVPGKVSSHIQTEWADIKSYQAKSWADAKEQWNSLKAKFVKTGDNQ